MPGHHRDPHQHHDAARDLVKYPPGSPEPAGPRRNRVGEKGGQQERNRQPQRIDRQQQDAAAQIRRTGAEGQDRADVIKAMDACYVGATGRFVNAKLSEADVGMAGCRGLFTALRVNRSTLGSFLKDVGEDQAAYDSRLNERIGDKVRSACPDLADGILGT